jgi:hypothetical protein
MTLLLRTVRLIALAIWVGGLVFFGLVAKVAFDNLHDPAQAGLIVRGSLLDLHTLGLAAGALYLILTVALIATQRDTHPIRAIELALVIAMLSLTAWSQFSVIPRMEAGRLALTARFGEVNHAPTSDPARQRFDRLHDVSVKLEGAVLLEGLVLLALSTQHGRDDYDRFA